MTETITLASLLEDASSVEVPTLGARHAHEAERALLGACLFGGAPAVLEALEEGVTGADFGVAARAATWEAIQRLVDRGDDVHTLAVVEDLLATGNLTRAGGGAAVAALEAGAISAATVRMSARAVVEDAAFRRLAELADTVRRRAVDRAGAAADVLAAAQEAFCALSRKSTRTGAANRAEIVRQVLRDSQSDRKPGLPTGWAGLDEWLASGLRPGQSVIVAARPAMGKSAFGHQLAAQVADLGVPTAFVSLEMSPEELIAREIAAQSRTPASTWRTREGASRAARAAGHVADRALQIHHCPGTSVGQVGTLLRQSVTRDGVGLAVIDYLGLLLGSDRYRGQRTQEVGEISRAIKALAGELRIPIVTLAQLNRGVEARENKRPGLADLRDSGEIEQDADIVMFVHRPEYYLREKTPPDLEGKAEIVVAKQRNGPTGVCVMQFDGPTTRFTSVDTTTREYR